MKFKRHKQIFSFFTLTAFILTSILPPQISYAQTPALTLSPSLNPPIIKGITLYPNNPLQFDFIVSQGDETLSQDKLRQEGLKMIKYFLASLTIPNNDMWVNLSPYEKNRIISDSLGQTEMGRDFLAQDYILKQITSALTSPENELGKKFWERIYSHVRAEAHTTDIPVYTLNPPQSGEASPDLEGWAGKVWIVPDKAVVYEHGQSAFVVERHLKVMLEEDIPPPERSEWGRLGGGGTKESPSLNPSHKGRENINTQIIRQIILPAIEREVNEGQNFATLRQVYNSMILASWYKETLKESLLGKVYVDKNKTRGINTNDPKAAQKIYDQYLEALKKGVANFIKDEYDPATQQIIPRKYFSGGLWGPQKFERVDDASLSRTQRAEILDGKKDFAMTVRTTEISPEVDNATLALAQNQPLQAITESPDAAMMSRKEIERLKNEYGARATAIYRQQDADFVKNVILPEITFPEFAAGILKDFSLEFRQNQESMISSFNAGDKAQKQTAKMLTFAQSPKGKMFSETIGRFAAIQYILKHNLNEFSKETILGNTIPDPGANQKPFLDLASGTNALAFFPNLDRSRQYIFVDTSDFVVAYLNEGRKALGLEQHIEVLKQDVFDLDLPPGHFGTIRLANIFGYVTKTTQFPVTFFRKIVDSIAPGGQLVVEKVGPFPVGTIWGCISALEGWGYEIISRESGSIMAHIFTKPGQNGHVHAQRILARLSEGDLSRVHNSFIRKARLRAAHLRMTPKQYEDFVSDPYDQNRQKENDYVFLRWWEAMEQMTRPNPDAARQESKIVGEASSGETPDRAMMGTVKDLRTKLAALRKNPHYENSIKAWINTYFWTALYEKLLEILPVKIYSLDEAWNRMEKLTNKTTSFEDFIQGILNKKMISELDLEKIELDIVEIARSGVNSLKQETKNVIREKRLRSKNAIEVKKTYETTVESLRQLFKEWYGIEIPVQTGDIFKEITEGDHATKLRRRHYRRMALGALALSALLKTDADTIQISAQASEHVQTDSDSDHAMPAPGGIDLNPDLMDLQIKRDKNGVPLPISQQPFEGMKIDGFLPVIIQIKPIDLPLLLGESTPKVTAEKT